MFAHLTIVAYTFTVAFAGLHYGGHSGKYSSGAELTSLAHSSAVQAKTAVINQQTAGNQAAFGAASNYAQTALGAASTAQAALVGKQAIVQSLKRQLIDAQVQLQAEIAQYQQTQSAAGAAQEAAGQTQTQLNSITAVVAAAQTSATLAAAAATETANVDASQQHMVIESKQRIEQLAAELQSALAQLAQTEAAAQKAASAAQIAQSNAAAAASAVAVAAEGSQISEHDYETAKGW